MIHDLRKNPGDLPKDYETVYVILVRKEGTGKIFKDLGCYYQCMWLLKTYDTWSRMDVVAWADLPQLGDEDNGYIST